MTHTYRPSQRPAHDGASPEFTESIETGLFGIAPGLLRKVSSARRLLSWFVGLLAFLTFVLVASHFGSLERTALLIHSARPGWLLAAIIAQGVTYVSSAFVWRQVLRRAGHPRSLRSLIPLGFAKLFTDQVLPSGGISGTVLVVNGLIRRRVPPEIAMAAMLGGLLSYDIAYFAVVMTSIIILWLHHRTNLPIFIGVGIFAFITVAVPTTVLSLKRWGKREPIAWLSGLLGTTALLRALVAAPTDLLHNLGLLVQTAFLQLGIFALDALTLWLAFSAIGNTPSAWVVFVSFIMASMAATIGAIPLGLGTFEAGSVGMLRFLGVPIEAALAGTLLLRGLTFWLPMFPGLWLARREIGRL